MDLEAPLKPEVLRPLVTLIVPGTLATGPFVLITGYYVPEVAEFWTSHPNAFSALLALAILAIGFMLDDFGTHIEIAWLDRRIGRDDKTHMPNWDRYLKLQLKDELIAHRYLRLKLTQLKFELAMAIALPVFWIGLVWLDRIYRFWSGTALGFVTVVIAIGVASLLHESLVTAKLLSRTRLLILTAIDEGVKGFPGRSIADEERREYR